MILTILIVALGMLNVAVFGAGAFDARLDLVSNAAPLFLASGVVAAVAALMVRRRTLALVAVGLTLAPSASVMGLDAVGALKIRAERSGGEVKVLALNVWSANLTPQAVEALIAREQPDIILLQEASSKRHRLLLARLAGSYPVNVNVHEHCSTRVLSRFELIAPVAVYDCALVGARLALPQGLGGGEVLAVSAHLPRGGAFREGDARAAFHRLSRTDVIVGGDFNRTPWSWALRRYDAAPVMTRRTHALGTWPSPSRRMRWPLPPGMLAIDHVYATPDWNTVSVRRLSNAGSDHYAVLVELRRRP